MHDMGTSWTGTSVVHEVTMENNYEFSLEESIGSQPEGSDPYRDTRDASYIAGNAERRPCKMGDVDSKWADVFLPVNDYFV